MVDWSKSPNAPASTSAASGVAGGIAGAASGLGETLLQQHFNEKNAQKAFERQRKLLREEYDYNQKAQRNSVRNMMQSAIDAGLSPVAMTGQNFSPAGASASGVSAASIARPELSPDRTIAQNLQIAGQVDLMSQQIKDLQASIDLKDAQRRNVDSDTHGKDIDNANKEDANASVNENMLEHLRAMSSLLKAQGQDVAWIDEKIKDIEQGDRNYTMGALNANKLFEEYRKQHARNIPVYNDADFAYKVSELKKKNPKIAQAIATLPISEQDKIEAEITRLYADAYKLQTSAQLDASKIDEIETGIKQMVQRMKSEYLKDPRLMLADEDYAHFASWLGMDVYEKGMSVLQNLISARQGQLGSLELQELKNESQNAPTVTEKFDRTGAVQGGQRTYKELPEQQEPNYKQPKRKRKRKR